MTAFWVDGLGAHAEAAESASLLADLIGRALAAGAGRVDIAGEMSAAAAVIAVPGVSSLIVELHADDRRHMLRSGRRRRTSCWVSGRDRILPSDASWTVQQAATAVLAWVRQEPVGIEGAHVQEVVPAGDADSRLSHRDRVFQLVEQYRRLHGRHVSSSADLHAFLLGAVGIAGATRFSLTDVVERSAPSGPRAADALGFARSLDAAHEEAHRIVEMRARRDWLIGQVDGLFDTADVYRDQLRRKLLVYLECELGRSRVSAR